MAAAVRTFSCRHMTLSGPFNGPVVTGCGCAMNEVPADIAVRDRIRTTLHPGEAILTPDALLEGHTMTTPIKTTGTYAVDLIERIASTFAVAFLGTLVTGGWFDVAHVRDVSALQAAGLAAIAAVLSLVKGLVAKWVSNHGSASLAPGV
jgi:hypothetical protein